MSRPWTTLDADAKDALIGELVEALAQIKSDPDDNSSYCENCHDVGWDAFYAAQSIARAAHAKAHRNG